MANSKRGSATDEAAGYATGSLDGTTEEALRTFVKDTVVKVDLTSK